MAIHERAHQRRLELFSSEGARLVHDTVMQRPPALDQPARDALPEFTAAGGQVVELLFGDPGSPDDGGLSLVRVRFGPNYPLPRHSHSVDCLYYVLAGEARLGSRVVGPGEGFFVPADVPYGYTAGPEGVDVLEFRPTSEYDSRIRESPAGWTRIIEGVRANRERWAADMPPAS